MVVKGNAVTVASVAPLTENRTDVTLPSASAAAATRVWAVLTVTVPAAGEARLTVGEVPAETTTEMVAEVVCEPRLSVATAESV